MQVNDPFGSAASHVPSYIEQSLHPRNSMTSLYFHSFRLVRFEISFTELSVCVKKTILNGRSCSHIGILIVISPIDFSLCMFQADDHGIKDGKVNSPTCVALQHPLSGVGLWEQVRSAYMNFQNVEMSFWIPTSDLRQRIVLKCVPHEQHDYFSLFNQSDHFFLASLLLLPSSLLKLLIFTQS